MLKEFDRPAAVGGWRLEARKEAQSNLKDLESFIGLKNKNLGLNPSTVIPTCLLAGHEVKL